MSGLVKAVRRAFWRHFALSEFSLKAEPLSGAGQAAMVKLINPQRTSAGQYPVAVAGWQLGGPRGRSIRGGKNGAAFFEIESSRRTGFEGGTKLTFTLDFQYNDEHAIAGSAFRQRRPGRLLQQEKRSLSGNSPIRSWLRFAAAYHLLGDQRRSTSCSSVSRKPPPASAICTRRSGTGIGRSPNTPSRSRRRRRTRHCSPNGPKRTRSSSDRDLAAADWTRALQRQPDVGLPAFQAGWRRVLAISSPEWRSRFDGGCRWDFGTSQRRSRPEPFGTFRPAGQLQLEKWSRVRHRFQMKSPGSCAVTLVGVVDRDDYHGIPLKDTLFRRPSSRTSSSHSWRGDLVRIRSGSGSTSGRSQKGHG